MKKVNLNLGGHPFGNDDLVHIQEAYEEGFETFFKSLVNNPSDPYKLHGCEITTSEGSVSTTSGAIFYQDEFFIVDAQSIPEQVSEQIGWKIDLDYKFPENTIFNAAGEPIRPYQIRKLVLTYSIPDLLDSSLVSLQEERAQAMQAIQALQSNVQALQAVKVTIFTNFYTFSAPFQGTLSALKVGNNVTINGAFRVNAAPGEEYIMPRTLFILNTSELAPIAQRQVSVAGIAGNATVELSVEGSSGVVKLITRSDGLGTTGGIDLVSVNFSYSLV